MNIIKSLELHGFKSFNKKTKIIFPFGLNVIIGPNGSGKSNILDALCFVFGKTSKKSLRAHKLNHLIFNGGVKGKPSKFAQVSVTLDNSSDIFPMKVKEIVISRKVTKDGRSEFFINSKRSSRQQIIELLSYAGIDPDGYNIILQGQIQNFVDMSNYERRKLIEEIAGISTYEDRKKEAMNNLEKVEEKIKEVEYILEEKRKNLEQLKKEKKQAEKYKQLSEELFLTRAKLSFKKLNQYKEGLQKLNSEIEEFNEKLKDINTEIEFKNSEILSKENKLKEIEKEIVIKGGNERKEINDELLKLNGDKVKLQNTILNLNEKISNLKNNKKELLEKIKDYDIKIKQNKNDIQDITNEINSLKLELKEKTKIFNEKSKEFIKLRNNLERISNLLMDKKTRLIELKSLYSDLSKRSELEDKIKSTVKDIDLRKKEILRLNKQLDELNDQYIHFQNKDEDLSKKLRNIESKLSSVEAKIKVNERFLKKGVKNVLDLRNEINGIYGLVSDLGSVKEKYVLPLSVVAGNKSNWIVVENDEVAQYCIEYLRKNKLGVATFIPLNKIKVNQSNDKSMLSFPGVIDYAINLISFNPKFKKVFSYIFGQTLVVSSLSTARKLIDRGYRSVTLDGDLVSPSGIMSGGFRSVQVGFREEDLQKEHENLILSLNKIKNDLSIIKNKKENLMNNITTLKTKRAELQAEVNVLNNRLLEYKSSLSKYENINVVNFNKLNNEVKELEFKKEQLSKKIEKIKQEDKEGTLKIEEELKTLEENIRDLGIEKTGLETRINIMKEEKLAFKDSINKIDLEIKENKNKEKELSESLKSIEVKIRNLEKKERELSNNVDNLLKSKKRLLDSIDSLKIDISNLNEKKNKISTKINDLKIKKAELNAKYESSKEEFEEFSELKIESVSERKETLISKIKELKRKIREIGNVNLKSLEVFDEALKQFEEKKEKADKLSEEKEKILELINEIESKKKDSFLTTFNRLKKNFEIIFSNLSPGGSAKLLLEDEKNPLDGENGVEVLARPRGKKFITLRAMSGGEKTITALSFIFAIQEYKPAPFYVLDEVDAALDKENSVMLGKLLKKYSKTAQYIVISHNENVFSKADRLYGVSMVEGESKVVAIELN